MYLFSYLIFLCINNKNSKIVVKENTNKKKTKIYWLRLDKLESFQMSELGSFTVHRKQGKQNLYLFLSTVTLFIYWCLFDFGFNMNGMNEMNECKCLGWKRMDRRSSWRRSWRRWFSGFTCWWCNIMSNFRENTSR